MFDRRMFLASSLALAACGKSTAGPTAPLRVATYRGGVETYTAAAKIPDLPFKVQSSRFASGNLITEAINAGAIDLGSMSDIPPIFTAQRASSTPQPASPMRLIAVLQADVANQIVLVPKASRVRTIAQLRGKRIGYVRATTSHYILLHLLEETGMTWKDITPVALAPQDGRAAFERGDLDAWVIFGVIGWLAREATGARVLTTGVNRLTGNYVYAASRSALDDKGKRADIGAYLCRVRDTYGWTEAHPEQAIPLIAKATDLPPDVYRAQRAERSGPPNLIPPNAEAIASQQKVADAFFKAGAIPAHVDVAPLWERDFDYRTA